MLKPHLACDADLSKISYPVMGFPKIDGVRGIHITGSMTGRSLKPHENKFITSKYSLDICTGFDGELTAGGLTSQSLCRDTTSALNTRAGEPNVSWNLFDWLHPSVVHKPYKERYEALWDYYYANQAKMDAISVSVIPYTMLNSAMEVEAFYEKCLEEGYEGVVLRDPDGMHKSGRATVKAGAYLRIKPQSDKEAVVLRLVEAMENQNEAKINELGHTERSSHKENKVGKAMVGMLVCKDLTSGMEIDVGAGKMTHEERTHYFNNPAEIVGKFIKYRSMDVGVKDKPRFARFICIRAESDMSE